MSDQENSKARRIDPELDDLLAFTQKIKDRRNGDALPGDERKKDRGESAGQEQIRSFAGEQHDWAFEAATAQQQEAVVFSSRHVFWERLGLFIVVAVIFFVIAYLSYQIRAVEIPPITASLLGVSADPVERLNPNQDYTQMGGVPVPDDSEFPFDSSVEDSGDPGSMDAGAPDSSDAPQSSSAQSGTASSGGQSSSSSGMASSSTVVQPPVVSVPVQLPSETAPPPVIASKPPSSQNPTSVSPPSSEGEKPGGDTVSVLVGGQTKTMNATEAVAGWVAAEIPSYYPTEAIKAQTVAAYTYIKYYNAQGIAPSIVLKTPTERVLAAVRSVEGIVIYTQERIAFTPWFAMSIGKTLSSEQVWGGSVSNLKSVDSAIEIGYSAESYSTYESKVTFSVQAVRQRLESVLGITLSANPDQWFSISSHLATVQYKGREIGYVGQVSIDGKVNKTGRFVRESLLNGLEGKMFRSPAFDRPVYDAQAQTLTFTTYGYGHGCGMSQSGMRLYADQGWGYKQILQHYYTGIEVR